MRNLLKKTWFRIGLILLVAVLIEVVALIYKGIIWIGNDLPDKFYPVRGVDVSHYQGNIDWSILNDENIYFAFIKATEGSSAKDDCFDYNWKEAHKTDLKVGAYHFFSFDSPGDTQADNYISTVEYYENAMPPVVDFEFYGNKAKEKPDKEATLKELKVMLEKLENYYNKKPIIYATITAYKNYLEDSDIGDYSLWIRNTYFKPSVMLGNKWTFWQYSDEGELGGYNGTEEHIDLNVYNGTEKEFYEEFGK